MSDIKMLRMLHMTNDVPGNEVVLKISLTMIMFSKLIYSLLFVIFPSYLGSIYSYLPSKLENVLSLHVYN